MTPVLTPFSPFYDGAFCDAFWHVTLGDAYVSLHPWLQNDLAHLPLQGFDPQRKAKLRLAKKL